MIDSIINSLDTQTIIFGGLTLVSLSLVGLVWKISKRYGNHSSDVIQRNTEAWIENAKSQQKHSDTLDHFGELVKESHLGIKRSIYRLSKVIEEQDKKK